MPRSVDPGTWRRREFLKRTTAVLGFPAILPATAWGAREAVPPGDRITVGFIGLGGQGTGHLLGGAWTYVPGGYVSRPDVQVVAVCDVRRDRREQAAARANAMYAQRYGQPGYTAVRAYADFRELLARDDIDAVVLALPYHWAAPMSIRALRAGKDVYCEKPVALTVRETTVLRETARRYGRIYQAGTQQRCEYGGKFRLANEMVRNGRIGALREVYAYRLPGAFAPTAWTSDRTVPVPDGFDWDIWLGPLPWRPYGGEAGHTLPGLIVGDVNWSPHHYDFAHWVVNPDPTAPVDIEFDRGAIRYHFRHGVVLHASAYPGEPIGADGGACFVGTDGRIAVDRTGILSEPDTLLRRPLRPGEWQAHRITSHAGNFLDCVRTRGTPLCPPDVAAESMNTILSGGIALALQRSLRWDPAGRRFSNDAEANRLLAYTPRPPWIT